MFGWFWKKKQPPAPPAPAAEPQLDAGAPGVLAVVLTHRNEIRIRLKRGDLEMVGDLDPDSARKLAATLVEMATTVDASLELN